MCKKLSSVFILVAGAALLLEGFGSMAASTASMVAGLFLMLFALHKLAHVFGMCSMCCGDGMCNGCGCSGDCKCDDMPMTKGKKKR